jgi:RNA polymerase sigma-70 factor (ECF subfamily)
MLPDSDTVERIRKGDKGQFEKLFRTSYVSLVRYAASLVKDQDTAEEIIQDLFVRIWQDREKLKIESSLNGYLFRSAHNRCLHHIAHIRVVERHASEVAAMGEDTTESPADRLQYRELQERIAGIIEKLPERCGQIFCLNRFEGLTYSEIAQKLSVSIKTVEANMGKALKEFRKELAE